MIYRVAGAGWSAVDLQSWQLDESGEIPGVNGADPGCREGAFQVHSLNQITNIPSMFIESTNSESLLVFISRCCVSVFRALKTRGNTPKYGLIFHSTFIGRAATSNKGRISRYLANKASIASRIDCFSGTFNSDLPHTLWRVYSNFSDS